MKANCPDKSGLLAESRRAFVVLTPILGVVNALSGDYAGDCPLRLCILPCGNRGFEACYDALRHLQMGNLLENASIDLPCSKCGKTTQKTIAWIKTHSDYVCSACGVTINLGSDQFSDKIRAAEKSLAELISPAAFPLHYRIATIDAIVLSLFWFCVAALGLWAATKLAIRLCNQIWDHAERQRRRYYFPCAR